MLFSHKIAISLGSDYICLASSKDEKVVSIPAYIAVTVPERVVVAAGEEARVMVGKEPVNIKAARLLEEGAPIDEEMFTNFLRYCIQKFTLKKFAFVPPSVLVTGHFKNDGPRNSVKQGVLKSGVKEVRLLDAGVAAAIGMDLPIHEPDFHCTLILEDDWALYNVTSLSGVVIQEKLNIGIKDLIEDLAVYLIEAKSFSPSKVDLKEKILSSGFSSISNLIGWEQWVGDLQAGRADLKDIDQEQMTTGISPAFLRAVHRISECHNAIEKEKKLEIRHSPIYLTGEYSRIPGLDRLLSDFLGRKIIRKDNGRTAMIEGALVVLKNLHWVKKSK